MNWTELKKQFSNEYADIPYKFINDAEGYNPITLKKWINSVNEEDLPEELIPIYGVINTGSYDADAKILLVNPITKEFYSIHGSHCSCYGFEGQFTPELCPIQYLATNTYWQEAKDIINQVIDYFISKE